jgi:hypothetical protein
VPPAAAPDRRVSARADTLLAELAALDDRKAAGEVDAAEHGARRKQLRDALIEELEAASRGTRTA